MAIVSDFFSCSQIHSHTEKMSNHGQQQLVADTKNNIFDANSILQQVVSRYYVFTFYKASAKNVYSVKLYKDETQIENEIKIEYSSPSQITVETKEGKNTKSLTSKNKTTDFFIDGEKKESYDDVYWGLTSTVFGKGMFFQVGKILILKERGNGQISVFQNLVDPQFIGEESIDGYACYKIQGNPEINELAKETYWIDKESFLIRQYEHFDPARKIPNGYFKTVETYTDIEAR